MFDKLEQILADSMTNSVLSFIKREIIAINYKELLAHSSNLAEKYEYRQKDIVHL